MLSGQGRHRYDDEQLDLVAGADIRIAAGVRQQVENTGGGPLECLIVFSSGNRETIFLE